jgi:transposase
MARMHRLPNLLPSCQSWLDRDQRLRCRHQMEAPRPVCRWLPRATSHSLAEGVLLLQSSICWLERHFRREAVESVSYTARSIR